MISSSFLFCEDVETQRTLDIPFLGEWKLIIIIAITILDIIHHPVFFLFKNMKFQGLDFVFGPFWVGSTWRQAESNLQNVMFLNKRQDVG
jgi:hypothetical protein